jgi:hypothetical protein
MGPDIGHVTNRILFCQGGFLLVSECSGIKEDGS